jgi:hypothetical protein
MSREKSLNLGTQYFRTQKLAIDYFKEILNIYRSGQIISEEDGRELTALITVSKYYDSNVEIGINHFEVESTKSGTNSFAIVFMDGSRKRFSYLNCINISCEQLDNPGTS